MFARLLPSADRITFVANAANVYTCLPRFAAMSGCRPRMRPGQGGGMREIEGRADRPGGCLYPRTRTRGPGFGAGSRWKFLEAGRTEARRRQRPGPIADPGNQAAPGSTPGPGGSPRSAARRGRTTGFPGKEGLQEAGIALSGPYSGSLGGFAPCCPCRIARVGREGPFRRPIGAGSARFGVVRPEIRKGRGGPPGWRAAGRASAPASSPGSSPSGDPTVPRGGSRHGPEARRPAALRGPASASAARSRPAAPCASGRDAAPRA